MAYLNDFWKDSMGMRPAISKYVSTTKNVSRLFKKNSGQFKMCPNSINSAHNLYLVSMAHRKLKSAQIHCQWIQLMIKKVQQNSVK